MNRDPLPHVILFCTKDGADKEYHVEIIEVPGGYSLKILNGKRGAAKEQKGDKPVLTLDQATKEFDRLVKEKTSPKKGYTTDASGIGYATSEIAGKMSGNMPHLLVPITLDRLHELVNDDAYGFEEKIDGERLMIDVQGGNIKTSNKLGVINCVSNAIVHGIGQLSIADILLDGENRNHEFHVFDILRLNGVCLKSKSTLERWQIFSDLTKGANWPDVIKPVFLHTGSEQKVAFLRDALRSDRENFIEGIVAKQLSAPYVPGRAAPKQATHLKYKLVEDSSCVVVAVSKTKRSATLGLFDESNLIREVGNVGIPANQNMPNVGDVIDVQYRHLYLQGDLCEPVYLKPRSDVLSHECMLTQVSRIKPKYVVDINDED
jgi:bifunctional non-homologous end joining protein LigD